jgi:hypothetical protein
MRSFLFVAGLVSIGLLVPAKPNTASAAEKTFDITTLKGKVESLRATAPPDIRFSARLEFAAEGDAGTDPGDILAPEGGTGPLPNPALLDGDSIQGPAITVNQDRGGAPQNETSIAVDPNNPNRVVASANDYVTGTWDCFIGGVPCSAFGDGYSGTYFSNDGGNTWCCSSSDPGHIGTLIPGVTRLTGGIYDAGGDPSVAFDSRGRVFYAGLGFNRASAPNTVAVNRGTFDASGALSWGAPTFINETTSPATINDKEWIAVDANPSSPFRDRVYVTFTRFLFNPVNGFYAQSPIMLAISTDGGMTFSDPKIVGAPVIYSQGSRPLVGADGTLYVIFSGAIRSAALNSSYIVKSTDGGATFGKPIAIAPRRSVTGIADATFRMNSFPSGVVAPDGTVHVAWTARVINAAAGYSICASTTAPGCHVAAVLSSSSDGGDTWSSPQPINPSLDAQDRTPDGYVDPVEGTPPTRRVDTFWAGLATTPSGTIYSSYYAADVISPRRVCTHTTGGVCDTFGFVPNARLDYWATNLTTGESRKLTSHPINWRYSFTTFIGDYTDLAVGTDGTFHALWTDTNNKQTIDWFFGSHASAGAVINQQDVAVFNGSF